MKRQMHDPILEDVLGGSELSELRKATLERGIAELCRRRRNRLALRLAGVAVASVLAVLGIVREQNAVNLRAREAAAQTAQAAVSPAGPPDRTVKTITDDELFALFPGRAMALIGKPGHQELVFLDGKPPQGEIQ